MSDETTDTKTEQPKKKPLTPDAAISQTTGKGRNEATRLASLLTDAERTAIVENPSKVSEVLDALADRLAAEEKEKKKATPPAEKSEG